MGLHTDFVLLDDDDDPHLLLANPDRARVRLRSRNMDPAKLELLSAIALGSNVALQDPVAEVAQTRFLFPLPPALVASVAASTPQARTAWAARWAESDEWWFAAHDLSAELTQVLDDLHPLALEAASGKGRLALWMSI